jgi:hypothetical protein
VTAKTRQLVMLVGALTVLGGVITYQLSPSGTAGNPVPPSNPREARTRTPEPIQVADVALDRLTPGADAFHAPRRDPFSFRPKPAPPPPPRAVTNQPPPTTFVPQGPPPPPPVRPIPLKYLGYAQHANGVRIALLSDGNVRPVMTGRQGDVIDGQYRLLRVDANEIEMSYLDGSGRRRIPKTGQ